MSHSMVNFHAWLTTCRTNQDNGGTSGTADVHASGISPARNVARSFCPSPNVMPGRDVFALASAPCGQRDALSRLAASATRNGGADVHATKLATKESRWMAATFLSIVSLWRRFLAGLFSLLKPFTTRTGSETTTGPKTWSFVLGLTVQGPPPLTARPVPAFSRA